MAVPIPDTTQLNATLVFKNMCDMYMYISNNELDQINYCDMKENKINQINQLGILLLMVKGEKGETICN